MTNYRIVIGDTLAFENSAIAAGSVKYSTAVDLPGAELSVDVFTAIVDYEQGATMLFSPADYDGVLTADDYLFGAEELTEDIAETPYGTVVYAYADAMLIGKYYIKNIVRVGRTKYQINAMSAIGFLDNQKHMGGIYSNVLASSVISEIVNGAFAYTVDPAIASQIVAGWLPIGTGRDNLHQLMFALGFSLIKSEDGSIAFVFLRDGDGENIPDNRIFIGGDVNYQSPATKVQVTEHTYAAYAGDESEQLFDNVGQASVSNLLVEFSSPHHDLTASAGLTIESSGVNYAVVSGVGTLTGKKYTHNTRTIEKQGTGSVENIITSDACTLVNSLNSENVAARLLAYYGSRKTVKADIVLNGEKSGDLITFHDTFGDTNKGIISQMETVASSFLRAACQIITDYVPTGQGNYYANRALITASGTWTAPAGVKRIRVVLIGGGSGGQGGFNGEKGRGGSQNYGGDMRGVNSYDGDYLIDTGWVYPNRNQPLAKGGAAGAAGDSGKIFVFDADITDGETLAFFIGAAGVGGAANGGIGTAGTNTTLSSASIPSCSSADGSATPFSDPLTGNVYALPGVPGCAGGDGGQTDTESLYAANGKPGLSGGNVSSNNGGVGGAGVDTYPEDLGGWKKFWHLLISGGGGGGAAYGHDGTAGTVGYYEDDVGYVDFYVRSGNGGNGANADAPDTPNYGCGGGGGNGGGAGGNGGGCHCHEKNDYGSGYYPTAYPGIGGTGGSGSVGGNGGAGCAIVYY